MAMYSFCFYFGFSVKGGFIIDYGFTNVERGLCAIHKLYISHVQPTVQATDGP